MLVKVKVSSVETPTVDANSTKFRRSPLILHDPSSSPSLALSEITMTDPSIFIRYPRFLSRWSQVKMGDQHVLVGQGKVFFALEGLHGEIPK
jgi:hypothetical protein